MKQYIDKSALVAEIERRIKGLKDCHAERVAGYAGEISGLERLLSFLDTLEVIGVDAPSSEGGWSSRTLQFIDADGNIKEITLNKAQKGE